MEADTPTMGTDAGESAPVQETTATPAVDRSDQSDDELLGIGSEEEQPAEAASEATTREAAEAKPVDSTTPQPDDVPEDQPLEALESAELKRLLDKEPAIRKFYFSERAYRELFPTVNEAREMRSMFPTVEDAQGVLAQAQTLLQAERTIQERPADFVKGFAQNDPTAFERFAQSLPEAIYESDPQLYRTAIAEPAVFGVLARMADGAVRNQDEELHAAIGVLRDRLNLPSTQGPAPTEDPRIAELEQLKREAAEREEKSRQETSRNFESSITRTVFEGIDGRIANELKRLNPAMSPAALELVHGQIRDAVVDKLTANQWLSSQAQQLGRSGDFGPAHLQQVVGLLAKHADPLIAPAVSNVMRRWTEDILRVNAQQLSETKRIAGKREVGSGNEAPRDGNGRFKKVKAGDPAYNKMTPDQILDMEI